jgi:hypothetical protein
MTVQQVIAELEGTAHAVDALVARILSLAKWVDLPCEQRGDEIPLEHRIAIREINLSVDLAEQAIYAADKYAPGTLVAWQKLRSNLDGVSKEATAGDRERAVASNMMADAFFLRKTAAVLRSGVDADAEPGAAADGGRDFGSS